MALKTQSQIWNSTKFWNSKSGLAFFVIFGFVFFVIFGLDPKISFLEFQKWDYPVKPDNDKEFWNSKFAPVFLSCGSVEFQNKLGIPKINIKKLRERKAGIPKYFGIPKVKKQFGIPKKINLEFQKE